MPLKDGPYKVVSQTIFGGLLERQVGKAIQYMVDGNTEVGWDPNSNPNPDSE